MLKTVYNYTVPGAQRLMSPGHSALASVLGRTHKCAYPPRAAIRCYGWK